MITYKYGIKKGCTLFVPLYTRIVWHHPQTKCATSVPAQNAGGKFVSEMFISGVRANANFQKMHSFIHLLKGQLDLCTGPKKLRTPVSVKFARCKFINAVNATSCYSKENRKNEIDLTNANCAQMDLNIQILITGKFFRER